MRSFIALPLPPEITSLLANIERDLQRFGADVRWCGVGSIHLTLKFLGEIDPAVLPGLARALEERVAPRAPFPVDLGGLGGFPNLRSPKVLWCGLGETEALTRLQADVEEVCRRHGFEPDARPFRPHLTLGRVQGRRNLQPLLDHIRIGAEPVEARFTARQCNVYRSTLRPAGAVYDVLKEIRLAGEGDPR